MCVFVLLNFLMPSASFGFCLIFHSRKDVDIQAMTFQDRLNEIVFIPNLPNGFENSHEFCRKHTISIAAGPAIITRAIWSFRFRSEKAPFSAPFHSENAPLPRQARDKHRESTPKRGCILLQHPTPYYDDSYAVNSASMGPWYALLPHTHTH